jgi:hypothetical protein
VSLHLEASQLELVRYVTPIYTQQERGRWHISVKRSIIPMFGQESAKMADEGLNADHRNPLVV